MAHRSAIDQVAQIFQEQPPKPAIRANLGVQLVTKNRCVKVKVVVGLTQGRQASLSLALWSTPWNCGDWSLSKMAVCLQCLCISVIVISPVGISV